MFIVGSFRILSNNQESYYPAGMQSEPSQARRKRSQNSLYSAVSKPLGFYHLGGMKSPTCPRIKIPFPNSAGRSRAPPNAVDFSNEVDRSQHKI